MSANDRQVGGDHYKRRGKIQHWDFAAEREYDYFQGQITKYVDRWKDKNGIIDLEKAKHFLEKYIEIEKAKMADTNNKILVRGELEPTKYKAQMESGKYQNAGQKLDPYTRGGSDNTGQSKPFGYDPAKDI